MSIDVKICGMTNVDDVVAAIEYGADYIGFVLYDKSPRGITPELLRKIMDGIDFDIKAIGVFVNESRDYVEKVMDDCGLYAAQLHGCEAPDDFVDFGKRMWRALSLEKDTDCKVELGKWAAERFVIDAAVSGMYGGTGILADWGKAAEVAFEYPVMLAGGLTPANVAEAIAVVRPLGVDVSSGLELEPGYKDYDKMKVFMEKIKQ